MREPHPVRLTRAERQTLRVIEEALTDAHPELALLMDEVAAAERLGRLVRTIFWIYLAVAVVVFLFGLVVNDQGVLGCGIVMLMLAPIVVPCAVAIQRRWC